MVPGNNFKHSHIARLPYCGRGAAAIDLKITLSQLPSYSSEMTFCPFLQTSCAPSCIRAHGLHSFVLGIALVKALNSWPYLLRVALSLKEQVV